MNILLDLTQVVSLFPHMWSKEGLVDGSVFNFQMTDPGRYLQCIRTLRDYAGKGCWEAQVCDLKEGNDCSNDDLVINP